MPAAGRHARTYHLHARTYQLPMRERARMGLIAGTATTAT